MQKFIKVHSDFKLHSVSLLKRKNVTYVLKLQRIIEKVILSDYQFKILQRHLSFIFLSKSKKRNEEIPDFTL